MMAAWDIPTTTRPSTPKSSCLRSARAHITNAIINEHAEVRFYHPVTHHSVLIPSPQRAPSEVSTQVEHQSFSGSYSSHTQRRSRSHIVPQCPFVDYSQVNYRTSIHVTRPSRPKTKLPNSLRYRVSQANPKTKLTQQPSETNNHRPCFRQRTHWSKHRLPPAGKTDSADGLL